MSLSSDPPDPMPASGAVATPPPPPAAPPIAPAPHPHGPMGSFLPRMTRQRPLVLFGIAFAVILVVVLAVVILFAPKAAPPRCPDPDQPCLKVLQGGQLLPAGAGLAVTELPPPATSTTPILRNNPAWVDTASTVQIDYDNTIWTLDTTTPAGLMLLTAGQGAIVQRIEVDKATDIDAPSLLSALEQFTAGIFTGVARDNSPANMPLHPLIGYKDAVGEYLVGTSREGGQITNYGFYLVAASDTTTNATIGVLVAVPEPDRLAGSGAGAPRIVKVVAGLVDETMKHVYWTPPQ